MQAALASIIYTQVAVAINISHELLIYWQKFKEVSWGAGPNNAKIANKYKKWTSYLYFEVWIESLTFGYIAQHKCKHGAAAT